MSYKIIVLDLDGTLTNSEKVITPKTKEALMQIQKEGKTVVLASGRPTPGVTGLAEELELEKYGGYILSYNGAKIINCKTKEIVYNKTVPEEYIKALYENALEMGVGVMSYSESEIILGNGKDKYCELEAKINHLPMKEIDHFVEYIDFPVNKFLMTGEPEKILAAQEKLREQFKDKLNIFRSEPFFLEIMPPEIDKAFSLGKLLEFLGADKSEMICCGDGFNDLSMIKFAGLGVAMANAQEEVKQAADFITYSNDEDGVAHVIEKFMRSKIVLERRHNAKSAFVLPR